jgi:hypothetical protein
MKESLSSNGTERLSIRAKPLLQVRYTTAYPPIPWSTGFADTVEARVPLGVYDSSHKAIAVLKSIALDLEVLV